MHTVHIQNPLKRHKPLPTVKALKERAEFSGSKKGGVFPLCTLSCCFSLLPSTCMVFKKH